MCLNEDEVDSIRKMFEYNPHKNSDCMNSGKISFFMTLVDDIDKTGGIVGYQIIPEEESIREIHSEIPEPLEEPLVEYISESGLGYFYNLNYNSDKEFTSVNVKFSTEEKINKVLNQKRFINNDILEGYLFGYPHGAVEQYKSDKNIDKEYRQRIIELKEDERIDKNDLVYLVSFIQYIPELRKDNIIKAANKGRERYEILKECCSKHKLKKANEIIEQEIESDREWIENLGE